MIRPSFHLELCNRLWCIISYMVKSGRFERVLNAMAAVMRTRLYSSILRLRDDKRLQPHRLQHQSTYNFSHTLL